jgi:nucleotide-binding universal stress UspA family protein
MREDATGRRQPGGTGNYLIVAGVDGSEGGHRALRWAVSEAAARHGTVEAVAVWRRDLPDYGLDPSLGPGEPQERADALLRFEIDRLPSDVPVASQVVEGRPAEALTTVARDADLLVLGSHGHSRVWQTVLGTVADECVRKATCPVVVVPVPHREEPAAPPALS